eukprot:TRINITY_DN45003_c0_g1_i1.p3 TRINITY_DN45003_c0_g1~~TRINITY_DN45003_c0_g1_i1.p3  ORF type:complete len:140 (+),score=38.05 TRINITY_DN45003_c0_g1_i1:374-793(+)
MACKLTFELPTTSKEESGKPGKRARQPHSISVDDSEENSESRGLVRDLLKWVQKLELVTSHHDDAIRSLENMMLTTVILKSDNSIAKALLAQNEKYQSTRPPKGPHPLGPPRRGLGFVLVNIFMQEESPIRASSSERRT